MRCGNAIPHCWPDSTGVHEIAGEHASDTLANSAHPSSRSIQRYDRAGGSDMSEPTPQAQIDAATAYEALFVPALFGQWTPRVADAAQIERGQRVLDVACGTGVLAREAVARTGSTGQVAGLDPVPGMLVVAKQLAPSVEWREGVAELLPFADRAFDAVVSQFGLMFFTDRHRALREMLRVLTPGGRLAVAVWDSLASNPAYAAEVALLE